LHLLGQLCGLGEVRDSPSLLPLRAEDNAPVVEERGVIRFQPDSLVEILNGAAAVAFARRKTSRWFLLCAGFLSLPTRW